MQSHIELGNGKVLTLKRTDAVKWTRDDRGILNASQEFDDWQAAALAAIGCVVQGHMCLSDGVIPPARFFYADPESIAAAGLTKDDGIVAIKVSERILAKHSQRFQPGQTYYDVWMDIGKAPTALRWSDDAQCYLEDYRDKWTDGKFREWRPVSHSRRSLVSLPPLAELRYRIATLVSICACNSTDHLRWVRYELAAIIQRITTLKQQI